MLTTTDFEGQSLLAQAALEGERTAFENVLTALRERLQSNQVNYRLFYI